jgi:hypothetical protein
MDATDDRDVPLGWPPGHFYSPIPSLSEVRRREGALFSLPSNLPGIDLNEATQLELIEKLADYYPSQPFTAGQGGRCRFYFENPNFSYGEALVLHCLLRHLKPNRVVEVGSGFTSCVFLDTNELHLGGGLRCTFIEPDPSLLYSLLRDGDRARLTVIDHPVQDVDRSVFAALEAGDVLFIDSTHVSKIGSDVNHLLFDILPLLRSGVYIHFHDVYYPFEYPRKWVFEGRAWNEAYLLHAFLQYNREFRIQIFNSFLGHFHRDRMGRLMPLFVKNPGSSIWLTRA